MNYSDFQNIANHDYSLYQEFDNKNKNKQLESNEEMLLKGNYRCTKNDNNELTNLFFSDKNVDRIQKKIKEEIFLRSKGKYKLDVDQDPAKLLIQMRGVFFQQSRFLPIKIIHQVKQLNMAVVNNTVPDMLTEIEQYYGYIKDINEPLKPMMRPMNVSTSGTRQHKPFIN